MNIVLTETNQTFSYVFQLVDQGISIVMFIWLGGKANCQYCQQGRTFQATLFPVSLLLQP